MNNLVKDKSPPSVDERNVSLFRYIINTLQ